MKRVEVIANRSVEDDLMGAFAAAGVALRYTKYPIVHGVGDAGPRMGDPVWPEENFALVCYCEEEEARRIAAIAEEIRLKFPKVGIAVFIL